MIYQKLRRKNMSKSLKKPGSVLLSLIDKYQLNPYALSREISLSYSAVRQIISGESKITVQTAFRLGKFFGQDPVFWLDLQRDADILEAEQDKKLSAVIKGISKVGKPGSVKKPAAAKKPASRAKAKAKSGKKASLSAKRKQAAKAPGAKPASRKKIK